MKIIFTIFFVIAILLFTVTTVNALTYTELGMLLAKVLDLTDMVDEERFGWTQGVLPPFYPDGTSILPRDTTLQLGATSTPLIGGFFHWLNATTTRFNGVTYNWPATDGTSNYVLSTNGSGVLSWALSSGSGGSGGSNWVTSSPDRLILHPLDTAQTVVIGGTATTSDWVGQFEVVGNALFDSIIASASSTFLGDLTSEGGFIGALTGNADTATALAANGANCAAGEIPLGVGIDGAVEDCYEPTEADITDLVHYVDADVSTYLTGGTGITESSGTLSFDCSEVEGIGIDCAGEAVTLDATGDWTGTFDGIEGALYLQNILGATLGELKDVSTTSLANNEMLSWSGSQWNSTSTIDVSSVSTTALSVFDLVSCDTIDTDTLGNMICGTDDSTAGAGTNWMFNGLNILTPTSTIGLFIGASTTFAGDFTVGVTTTSLFVDAGGDVTAAGSITSNGNFIGNLVGNVTGSITGNAGTATALASNPTDCASGDTVADIIVASGDLTCTTISATHLSSEDFGDFTCDSTATGCSLDANILALDSLSDVTLDGPNDAEILIYQSTPASAWIDVAISGDCTIDNTGSMTCAASGGGSNWTFPETATDNFITPTSTVGIVISASSTMTSLNLTSDLLIDGSVTSTGPLTINDEVFSNDDEIFVYPGRGGTYGGISVIGPNTGGSESQFNLYAPDDVSIWGNMSMGMASGNGLLSFSSSDGGVKFNTGAGYSIYTDNNAPLGKTNKPWGSAYSKIYYDSTNAWWLDLSSATTSLKMAGGLIANTSSTMTSLNLTSTLLVDGAATSTGPFVVGDNAFSVSSAGTVEKGLWNGTAIAHEYGGLEADVNAYSGLLAISGGSTSEVDAKSELEAQIADVANFCEADGDVFTGTHDFGGADDLEIPNGAANTVDTAGQIALDTTSDTLRAFGASERVIPYWNEKCFSMASSTWQNITPTDIPMWSPTKAITVTDIYCRTEGGTSVSMTCGDTGDADFEAVICDADGQADDGTITNATFTANEGLECSVGTVVGAVQYFNYCITYSITAD